MHSILIHPPPEKTNKQTNKQKNKKKTLWYMYIKKYL